MSKKNVNELKLKAAQELEKAGTTEVSLDQLRSLVNKSIFYLDKSLSSTQVSRKEKIAMAQSIVNKYMPQGVQVKHEAGDSFLDVIKAIHKEEKPSDDGSKRASKGKRKKVAS